jgi:WD40 repeat protein
MNTILLSILGLLYFTLATSAQSLSVFDVDTSQFPIMKARFYALDANGQPVQPVPSEFTVIEEGQIRTVLSVTCPTDVEDRRLATVLVLDVSSSMASSLAGTPRMDIIKAGASSWVRSMGLGKNECAIVSFDDAAYLHQDFTTDRTRLLNVIASLQPQGGTNYLAGLDEYEVPGAVAVSKSRQFDYSRAIVLVTDGFINDPVGVLVYAQQNKIPIYTVPIGMRSPQMLKNIAVGTKGQWYENIYSAQQLEEVLQEILGREHPGSTCEITWESTARCSAGQRDLSIAWNGKTARTNYATPNGGVAQPVFKPSSINLRSRSVGQRFDTTITITAVNIPLIVTQITSSNPAFDITPKSFSLEVGQHRTLTVSYTPADSEYSWTRFDVQTDICPYSYYASGRYPGVRSVQPTLQVTQPNGGETLVAGSDTLIAWNGIPIGSTVGLQYSTDNGSTWTRVVDTTSSKAYLWHVPATPGDRCLVRIMQVPTSLTLKDHTNKLMGVAWSPDGTKVATASYDTTAKIWDANNGTVLRTLRGHIRLVAGVAWSPDGTKVLTASYDSTAKVWDINTGAVLKTFRGHTREILSVAWSPDGTKIVTGSADNTARIWDANNGTLLRTLTEHEYYVWSVAWSPDGTKIATGSGDNIARIWDPTNGSRLQAFANNGSVNCVAWSPDGTKLAAGCYSQQVKVWNVVTETEIRTIHAHPDIVYSVAWSPEGDKIISSGRDYTVYIWDPLTGAALRSIRGYGRKPVRGVAWSPDGSRIASAGEDSTAMIWDADTVIQSDISDATFAITMPQPRSHDVDMGRTLVNVARDSVVETFVVNAGNYGLKVNSVYISGEDAGHFALLSNIPPFTVPANGSHPVEFRFYPTSAGVKTAQLHVGTQTETIIQTIRGEGVVPVLAVSDALVYFPDTKVGETKSLTVKGAIRNNGSTPVDFSGSSVRGPDITQFSIIDGGGAFTLAPGESRDVSIRFAPQFGGRVSSRIGFDYNGVGSPAILHLFGPAYGASLSVSHGESSPGDQQQLRILGVYPNPASESAELAIELSEAGEVRVSVMDALGWEVETILEEELKFGWHSLKIGTNELATGTYFIQVRTPTGLVTSQMSIVR